MYRSVWVYLSWNTCFLDVHTNDFHQIWKVFRPLFLQKFLLPISASCLLLGSHYLYVGSLDGVSQVPESLPFSHSTFLHSSLHSVLQSKITATDLSSSILIPSCANSNILLNPSNEFLFIVIFNSRLLLNSFLYFFTDTLWWDITPIFLIL